MYEKSGYLPAFLFIMEKLKEKILNIIKSGNFTNYHILEVNIDKKTGYIKIIIDSETRISLSDTAKISRLLTNDAAIDYLFPNGYKLEVSSPGIDAPLKFPFQYIKNIGKDINISLTNELEFIKQNATIINANHEFVVLNIKSQKLQVSYDNIRYAKLNISFN
tara:strand:- start:151 stop:639 length:489 start_codon:yes stop_codon:yes gene_type:complete